MWTLYCQELRGSWSLVPGTYVLGRSPDSDIHVDDRRISRRHARLVVSDESVLVQDLQSSNGVFLNGRRVYEAEVHPGDVLGIGPVEFSLKLDKKIPEEELEKTVHGTTVFERGVISEFPSLDSTRLRVLYDVVEAIVGNLSLSDMLPAVLDTLEGLFSYDRCSLAVKDEEGRLVVWASRPERVEVPYSRTVVNRVMERGEAILYDDIQGEAPFDLGESVMGLNIRSVLCAPLDFRGEIKGLVYLDRSVAGSYSVDDLALLRSVSHVVAIALENARLYAELQERYEQKARELKEAQRRLVQSERAAALGHLAQAMAHHMRNPLMVIGGMIRRVQKAVQQGREVKQAELEAVLSQARRLERMMESVDKLINLPGPQPRLLPLEETVASSVEKAARSIGELRVEVHSSLNRRAIPHDPSLTETALVSVLENAAMQLTSGKPLHIFIGEYSQGWFIDVTDHEYASGQAEFKGIFDPFFQTHPWAVDLALTLAQRAMAIQGGDLMAVVGDRPGNRIRLCFRFRS